MSNKRRPSFDEFFAAFGHSVHADVELRDGAIVVSNPRGLLNDSWASGVSNSSNSRPSTRSSPTTKAPQKLPRLASPPQALDVNTVDPVTALPRHLAALVALQASDGSWCFDDKFQFVINGVAPPPPEGISPKLWATAAVVTILRQAPEFFGSLESAYEKAMLHVDDDVLRLAKSVIETTASAMERVRPYENNEAKAIRERLAREAAAKRAEEDAEADRLERERMQAIYISKYSQFRARHLPMETQELMRTAMTTDVHAIYPRTLRKPPPQLRPKEMEFGVGDTVECCWHRVDGSKRPQRHDEWRRCVITMIDADGKTLHVQFLDDPCERERHVQFKYVRWLRDDAKDRRGVTLERLREQWIVPIGLDSELERLHEIDARRKWKAPWETRSLPVLPTVIDTLFAPANATYAPRKRLVVTPNDLPKTTVDAKDEALYQDAVTAALAYTKQYTQVPAVVKGAVKRYASATLFQERFHAFDAFLEVATSLVRFTVASLERIQAWRSNGPGDRRFVWQGDDFVVRLLTSLDFLSSYPQVREWYGDDFAFSMNPFLSNESIRDLVHDRGLQFTKTLQPLAPENQLRVALRMHKAEVGDEQEIPSWWPLAQFDDELRAHIQRCEDLILAYLRAAGYVI